MSGCTCWNPARSYDFDCPTHGTFARRLEALPDPDDDHPYADELLLGGEGGE